MSMAKKSAKAEEPMKLFYIFYSEERWNNWLSSLREADFEGDPDAEEMPPGFQTLQSFAEDITISVLKIVKLYQNERFSKEEALEKLGVVEGIVMRELPEDDDLAEFVGGVQISLLALFASCRSYLEGGYEGDPKALVKEGRKVAEDDPEAALEAAAKLGAQMIAGGKWSATFLKSKDDPTIFDEWLAEIETISEAVASLKNFDEEPGEV
ncbi:Uncharacterized conserved protein UCP022079 [Methanofollis liminatans DSM 4140]|uniref:Uncharacterized conserved protein UCP022079 n=2 Tax=Methanofollis liminatans TaxID=2201 RepID=J1L273_9EURY|nr:Uncharacterized conserved protein UCP022079 [Methanofollis liminatans DSM 4140]